MANAVLGMFNLGGEQILLILILLSAVAFAAVIAGVLVFVILQAIGSSQTAQHPAEPPPVQSPRS